MPSLGDRIFDYSKPELEKKVDRFLKLRPFVGPEPPICPDLILARMPEVKRIEVDPLLGPKFKTEAMVLARRFMHRELTVIVDQRIMDQRDGAPFNMALAEEIGHIELHRAVMLDIAEPEDFLELQRHPRWAIAEHDAKYFGRALLMPQAMLEWMSAKTYQRVAAEHGFGDPFLFDRLFTVHLASTFEIPPSDAQKRIDAYVGGLRSRLDRSIAARSESLLALTDELAVLRSLAKVESDQLSTPET
jgi:hypothetical protein